MKETLSTISERTGISITTISRVLSGKSDKYRISKATAAIIEEEARRCNYTPSVLAQSLRTNKANTIGLIIPTLSNPYFADIASSIITAVKARGYTAIVVDTMENEENQKSCLSALLSRKVDGIIAAPCGKNREMFEEINNSVVPVVLVDRYFEGSNIPYVTSNNFKGAVDATTYLLQEGHTNIACIQGDVDSIPTKRRVSGYIKALKDNGMEDNMLIVGDSYSIQNGYLEGKLLLNRTPRPTAIFATSYTILLGVLRAIHDSGLSIPEDISIIGFDDNVSLDYMLPPVTRISQPVDEMGRLAARLLFENISRKDRISSHVELTAEIIVKDSVKSILNQATAGQR